MRAPQDVARLDQDEAAARDHLAELVAVQQAHGPGHLDKDVAVPLARLALNPAGAWCLMGTAVRQLAAERDWRDRVLAVLDPVVHADLFEDVA